MSVRRYYDLSDMEWLPPIKLKSGGYFRDAKPTQEFWAMWRDHKDQCIEIGLRARRENKWVARYYRAGAPFKFYVVEEGRLVGQNDQPAGDRMA